MKGWITVSGISLHVIALFASLWLLCSYTFMLIFGVMHNHWWHTLPPMGFTTSMVLSALWLAIALYGAVMQATGTFWLKVKK